MSAPKELHVELVALIQSSGQQAAIDYMMRRFDMSYREAIAQIRPAYLEAKGKGHGKNKTGR